LFLQIACYLPYYLWRIKKAQRLNPSELEELQSKKLRAIVKHAYENVPYYHKLFNSVNLKPNDIKTREDLVKVPITNKKILQKLPIIERISRGVNISKCVKCRTSGSTGEPLDIFLSRKELSCRIAMQTRVYGLNLKEKKVSALDCEAAPAKGSPAMIFERARKYLNHLGLWKRYYFSLLEEPKQLVSKLLEIKPDVIETQPSTMKLITQFVKENNITGIAPKLIFTRAELLNREDRRQIQSVFGARLVDLYGAIEFGIVARECDKHSGYHINSDILLVEAIKDSKQVFDEEGEIVCTDLTNYTMPFIRYSLGDIVVLSKERHDCGNSFPLIRLIQGRSNDFITLPSGKFIAPVVLLLTFENIEGISQYKLVQENINMFTVQIVKGQNFKETTIEELRNALLDVLGREARVNISIVNEIPKEKSGKVQPIVSQIPVDL